MTEYAVRNPATGELVETFPTATDADIAAAIDAAAAAYGSWVVPPASPTAPR